MRVNAPHYSSFFMSEIHECDGHSFTNNYNTPPWMTPLSRICLIKTLLVKPNEVNPKEGKRV